LRPLLSIPDIVREHGIDPDPLMARAGIDPRLFLDGDSRVPFDALGSLADEAATAIGCPHFGLLVAARFELSSLGALGYLMRNDSSVGSALNDLVLHLHLHDRGAVPNIVRLDERNVAFTYAIYHPNTPAAHIIYDAAMGIASRILHAHDAQQQVVQRRFELELRQTRSQYAADQRLT